MNLQMVQMVILLWTFIENGHLTKSLLKFLTDCRLVLWSLHVLMITLKMQPFKTKVSRLCVDHHYLSDMMARRGNITVNHHHIICNHYCLPPLKLIRGNQIQVSHGQGFWGWNVKNVMDVTLMRKRIIKGCKTFRNIIKNKLHSKL